MPNRTDFAHIQGPPPWNSQRLVMKFFTVLGAPPVLEKLGICLKGLGWSERQLCIWLHLN